MSLQTILEGIPAGLANPKPPLASILLLADHDDFIGKGKYDYSLAPLQNVLRQGGRTVDLLRRDKKAVNDKYLLHEIGLKKYQEIWFFLQTTDQNDKLDQPEIDALAEWMDDGNGVLVTGDHANPSEVPGPPIKKVYTGLGTPIGSKIPRAKHMRKWDDLPDTEPDTSYSSIISGKDPGAEHDELPQRLLLPFPRHSIFSADIFPDHMHEGVALAPNPLPADWFRVGHEPLTSKPLPVRIIAKGVDWRHGTTFDLMSAWDGNFVDPKYGRILADASWHHYVAYNRERLAQDDLNKIDGIFREQAMWLTPKAMRDPQKSAPLAQLLLTPEVVEHKYATPAQLGAYALSKLASSLSPVLFAELREELLSSAHTAGRPELLRDPGLEAHLIGIQVRRIREVIDDGKANVPSSYVAALNAQAVIKDAIDSYKLELNTKLSNL